MGRKKLRKFSDNENCNIVIQEGKPLFDSAKGKWRNEVFQNTHPLILELGCGRGEYSIGLGEQYPEKNFLGVDIKGARIWTGSQRALEMGLKNVAFLRTEIRFITDFFEKGEIDEIWITFPDPRPRDRDEKHRLTSPGYLQKYHEFLKPGGMLHLKTDNSSLFAYTLDTLNAAGHHIYDHTWDLYKSPLRHEHFDIKTRFEQKFVTEKQRRIKYVKFKLNEEVFTNS